MKIRIFIFLFFVSSIVAESNFERFDLSNLEAVEDRSELLELNNKLFELSPLTVDFLRRSSRIIGGWEVKPHSHPYAVFILSNYGSRTWRCSGSIISSTAVLTAAHCLDGSTSSLVVAGVHNVNTIEETQQRRRIQSYDYKIHENFNPQTLQNDIAALLIRDVPFSETREVQFAQLPYDYKRELFVGSMVSIVGWGRTCTLCQTSSVLRGIENYVIKNEDCLPYHPTFSDQQMCVQTVDVRGACFGDAGGPYTIPKTKPTDREVILIGIHSMIANGGCEAERPNVAVRLTHFLDWIDSNVKF